MVIIYHNRIEDRPVSINGTKSRVKLRAWDAGRDLVHSLRPDRLTGELQIDSAIARHWTGVALLGRSGVRRSWRPRCRSSCSPTPRQALTADSLRLCRMRSWQSTSTPRGRRGGDPRAAHGPQPPRIRNPARHGAIPGDFRCGSGARPTSGCRGTVKLTDLVPNQRLGKSLSC